METLVKLFGEFTFTIDCKGTIRTAWTANEAFLHGKVIDFAKRLEAGV